MKPAVSSPRRFLAILVTNSLCLAGLGMSLCVARAENPPAPALAVDRVGFPRGYSTNFALLRTVERDEGTKLISVYGNRAAASITQRSDLPYPPGSVLVMETATTRKGSDGKPARGPGAALEKAEVLGLHVMRREKNFGEAYGANRSGEWEFVEYRPDESYLTPPSRSAACAECHRKAGPELDFVYKGRVSK